MPKDQDTPGVELDQYQKEKDEFSDAMDEVFSEENEGKTNEEIAEAMAKKDVEHKDEAGIATKDPDDDATKKPAEDDSDVLIPGQGVVKDEIKPDDVPATVEKTEPLTDVDGLQKRVTALEEELAKEKQKTSSWNGRITAANKRVSGLETELEAAKQKQAPSAEDAAAAAKATASTESDNAVLDRFRNDFPELSSAFDIMQKRIDGVMTTPAKEAKPVVPAEHVGDAPVADEATNEHATAIRKVHSDLPEMVNTGVLLTWINQQPDFIRPTLQTIYDSGKAEDVINMVTEFKDKTGWKSQLTKADDKTKAANDKLNSMKEVNSETSIPNGKTVDKNDYDQGAKDAGF
jgi:hypothetical protein